MPGEKEVERLKIPFEPIYQSVGTSTRILRGASALLLDPDTLRRSVSFHAEFPGTSRDRIASTSLQWTYVVVLQRMASDLTKYTTPYS